MSLFLYLYLAQPLYQVSVPPGAPQLWNVFLQKGMTLEEMNEVKYVRFRLDITLIDDGSSFEDIAPVIVNTE